MSRLLLTEPVAATHRSAVLAPLNVLFRALESPAIPRGHHRSTLFAIGARVQHNVTNETGEVVEAKPGYPCDADRVPVVYDGDDQVFHTLARKLELEP